MKKSFLGILALTLIFGMAVIGCDDGKENKETKQNPFIGTWSGTVTTPGPQIGAIVTLNFAANLTWNFSIVGHYSLRGTYIFDGNSGTLTFGEWSPDGTTWINDFSSFPVNYNTATIEGNTMTIIAPGIEGSTIVIKQ